MDERKDALDELLCNSVKSVESLVSTAVGGNCGEETLTDCTIWCHVSLNGLYLGKGGYTLFVVNSSTLYCFLKISSLIWRFKDLRLIYAETICNQLLQRQLRTQQTRLPTFHSVVSPSSI